MCKERIKRDDVCAEDGEIFRPEDVSGTHDKVPVHRDFHENNGSETWRPASTADCHGRQPFPRLREWAVHRRLRSRRDMP